VQCGTPQHAAALNTQFAELAECDHPVDDIFLRLPNTSSRDTHAQSLRGAYITQRPSLPLTIFPNIFPLSRAFSLPALLHPPRDLSSFLCLFPARFFVSSSRHCFIPTCFLSISLRSFSLRPLDFSHASNSNSCRNCVFPQDSYSSWLPCDLHLQSSLEVSSYLI
jgi:hypothetical protein